MKKTLIIAACFISLINAADDTNEIELELGDSFSKHIFKGHVLDKKENAFASFVGIHQTARFTVIRAEYRKDEECVFGTEGGYEEVTFDHSGFQSHYRCYDGYRYSSLCIMSNNSKDIDSKGMQKALSLCQFYFKIHAKRALGLEK